jgi:hypothetical protein
LLQRDERQPHIFGIDPGVALDDQGHIPTKLPGPADARGVPRPLLPLPTLFCEGRCCHAERMHRCP